MKDQVSDLLNYRDTERYFSFKLCGGEVPMKISRVPNSNELLIIFHGAVNREKKQLPVFAGFVNSLKGVTQLSVADPSLSTGEAHQSAWYAGHDGFESQKILPEIFQEIILQGSFKRVVFFGGSAGGFASLYYSSFIVGSVAITFMPQTNIHKYYSEHGTRYRESCWPHLSTNDQLTEKICSNLCDWYQVPRPNTIIYIQSAGDDFHTRTQLAPFLATIAKVKGAKFIVNSDFWGQFGHSRSIDTSALLPWLQTAFTSPSTDVKDILTTQHSLVGRQNSQKKPETGERTEVSSKDLSLNKLIHDYQLRQMQG